VRAEKTMASKKYALEENKALMELFEEQIDQCWKMALVDRKKAAKEIDDRGLIARVSNMNREGVVKSEAFRKKERVQELKAKVKEARSMLSEMKESIQEQKTEIECVRTEQEEYKKILKKKVEETETELKNTRTQRLEVFAVTNFIKGILYKQLTVLFDGETNYDGMGIFGNYFLSELDSSLIKHHSNQADNQQGKGQAAQMGIRFLLRYDVEERKRQLFVRCLWRLFSFISLVNVIEGINFPFLPILDRLEIKYYNPLNGETIGFEIHGEKEYVDCSVLDIMYLNFCIINTIHGEKVG
jgi:hypothetical protein